MVKLVLVRGIAGSGKSTLAKKLAEEEELIHLEADQFLIINGQYEFNPQRLRKVHNRCWSETFDNLSIGKSVVVSNTFVRLRELTPYFEIARKLQIPIYIKEATGNFESIHGVPFEALERMKRRWAVIKLPVLHNIFPAAELFGTYSRQLKNKPITVPDFYHGSKLVSSFSTYKALREWVNSYGFDLE